MIISLLLMFIVADGCVFARLAGAEDVTIKLMELLSPGEGKRSRSQSVAAGSLLSINVSKDLIQS